MKAVTQEHRCGCGAACVAAVLGISYQKALKLFDKPKNAGTKGYYCRAIAKALAKKGKKYSVAYLKPSKKNLLNIPNSIVYIRRSSHYPLGHYLAKSPNGLWMDSWINYPLIKPAKSGFRKKLPCKPSYVIYPSKQ